MKLLGESLELVLTTPADTIASLIGFLCCGTVLLCLLVAKAIENDFSLNVCVFLIFLITSCVFCGIKLANSKMHEQTTYYYQIDNSVPYSDIVKEYDIIEQHGDLIILRDKEVKNEQKNED